MIKPLRQKFANLLLNLHLVASSSLQDVFQIKTKTIDVEQFAQFLKVYFQSSMMHNEMNGLDILTWDVVRLQCSYNHHCMTMYNYGQFEDDCRFLLMYYIHVILYVSRQGRTDEGREDRIYFFNPVIQMLGTWAVLKTSSHAFISFQIWEQEASMIFVSWNIYIYCT